MSSRFAFGSQKFWHEFYSRRRGRGRFEWFVNVDAASSLLVDVLRRRFPGARSVLHVGCGTSRLGRNLNAAGFDVTEVDQSQLVIDEARRLSQESAHKFFVADCRNMEPGWDSRFDAVVDKGTMDALLLADRDCRADSAADYGNEIVRVLNSRSGVYLHITDSPPEVRAEELAMVLPTAWRVVYTELPSVDNGDCGDATFLYTATRRKY